jgi:hypothetical protein
VAERTTKEVLLRLRRLRELELRRELVVMRAARAEARREVATLEAARRKLERSLYHQRERRQDGAESPAPAAPPAGRRVITAGRLAQADRFERAVEDALRGARLDERRAVARLDVAERGLATTQRALGDAVHARQRSESLAASERASSLRTAERRAEAELEDRYRAPRRSRR